MDGDEITKRWQVMSEEVISGMTEWRKQNPKATFREIEEEVDKRLAGLRVRMMTDTAFRNAIGRRACHEIGASGCPGWHECCWCSRLVLPVWPDYCGIDQYYSSWQPGGPELWTERIAEIYAVTGVFCLPGGREAAVKSLARPVLRQ